MSKREKKFRYLVITEGYSECNLLNNIKQSNLIKTNIYLNVKNAKGQGNIPKTYKKYSDYYYYAVIIMDHDRIDHDEILRKTKKLLKKDKKNDFIVDFIIVENNPKFENWLCSLFNPSFKNTSLFFKHMKYTDSGDLKNDTRLFEKICSKGGHIKYSSSKFPMTNFINSIID